MASNGPSIAVSTFQIRQTTGRKRVLILANLSDTSRALPFRPYALPVSMRHEVTWYPGNPNGTLQIFGAQEDEAKVNGAWHDRFLCGSQPRPAADSVWFDAAGQKQVIPGQLCPAMIDGKPLTTCEALVNAVEQLTREGQVVAVTWAGKTRYGVISKFTPTWQNENDVEWEMSFVWYGREGEVPPPVFAQQAGMAPAANQMVSDVIALARSAVAGSPVAAIASFGADLASGVAGASALSFQFQQLAQQTVTAVISPHVGAARGFSVAVGIVNSWRGFAQLLAQSIPAAIIDPLAQYRASIKAGAASAATPPQGLANPSGAVPSGTTPVVSVDGTQQAVSASPAAALASAAVWRAQLRQNYRALAVTAAMQASVLQQQVQTQVLAVHRARANEDLHRISTRYYATPHEWRRIYAFNGLNSLVLTAGQIVLIPKVTGAGGADSIANQTQPAGV